MGDSIVNSDYCKSELSKFGGEKTFLRVLWYRLLESRSILFWSERKSKITCSTDFLVIESRLRDCWAARETLQKEFISVPKTLPDLRDFRLIPITAN